MRLLGLVGLLLGLFICAVNAGWVSGDWRTDSDIKQDNRIDALSTQVAQLQGEPK